MLNVVLLAVSVAAPAAAPQAIERRLHPVSADASSFLWNDWNKFQENYHPNYVADDDPKTAWTEGAKGNGEGEWLRVPVTRLEGTTRVRLRLRNGYHKSKGLYAANARPRGVTVTLLPGGAAKTLDLADVMEWQEVTLQQPPGPFEGFELKIGSVYSGSKYEDTCLSDVQVFATSTTADNPAFEKSRLERLLAWKKERVEAAKLFKSERAGHMPVASSYSYAQDREVDWDADCDGNDPLCSLRAGLAMLQKQQSSPLLATASRAVANRFADLEPTQAVPTDKRLLPPVDGLQPISFTMGVFDMPFEGLLLPRQLGLLHAGNVGAFAVKDAPTFAAAAAGEAKACNKKGEGATFAWASYTGAEPKRVAVLALAHCGLAEGREGYFVRGEPALLVYDDQGRLGLVATSYQVALLSWSDDASPVLHSALVSHAYLSGIGRYQQVQMMAASP